MIDSRLWTSVEILMLVGNHYISQAEQDTQWAIELLDGQPFSPTHLGIRQWTLNKGEYSPNPHGYYNPVSWLQKIDKPQ